MTKKLDLLDIQGNVIRAYGRFGFPVARYICLNVTKSAGARRFLADLIPLVTTAAEWEGEDQLPKPGCALNVAMSYQGLKALGMPRASLVGFAPEFADGMRFRRDILGDDGPSDSAHWDPVWKGGRGHDQVHLFISLNAQTRELLEDGYVALAARVAATQGAVVVLGGHRGDQGQCLDYQDASAIMSGGMPTAQEHFGYTDGIGDPVFEGVPYEADRVNGRGKQVDNGQWLPLATGEFLLGHIDEAREYPAAPTPVLLARNSTYMVYRKLHENVATFDAYLEHHGQRYPGGKELLAAKFVGRWRDNGAPLVKAWDAASKAEFDAQFEKADKAEQDKMLCDFTYDADMSGAKCPFSAHMRRINPRASLEMTRDEQNPSSIRGKFEVSKGAFDTPGALSNRRRLLRRGLPYGSVTDRTRDDGNHGIIIMMINADIGRQFEFVQQQWINYGNDFKASNDKEILLGNHSADHARLSKAVLQVDPDGDEAPYFLSKIPRLVETRGGEYFFVPSMTALGMIARGLVDPT
jgi:deferrochelatase/peroxidase EfeB